MKLGNFRLSFTDLEIPVSGIPINVTRTYDSLNVGNRDDFGYGWRLEFRDTDLRTSLRKDEVFEQLGVRTVAFKDKTRVYITLPGGKREAFTFKPTGDRLNSYFSQPEARIYHPAFEGDKGVTSKLTVADTRLSHVGNEYFGLNGEPYNPADSAFGSKYVLTTKEGIVYEIDGVSGDLLTATDTNKNKVTFTDAGIFSDSGKSVTFGRDAKGRIVSVTDLLGKQVKYQYDESGDLVGVTDRENNTTQFVYNQPQRNHFLTEVIDPLGRRGVKNEYDEKGRLKKLFDANNNAVELIHDPNNFVETVKDVFGKATTYEYDARGNILTEIDPLGKVTKRTYNDENNMLSETVITEETGLQGYTTKYTYDSQGNQLTRTNPLNQTDRYTYNQFNQLLTTTDPLGNTTSYTFDKRGNVLSKKDAEGNIISYTYDNRGNALTITESPDDITKFEYDSYGNRIRKIDAENNETTYTPDANGKILTETTKLTTPNGVRTLVTTNTYDNEGNVKTVLDAENGLTKYEYDKNGNQTVVIDALGRRTEMRYDDKNQLRETILPDDTPNDLTDNLRTIIDYDEAGNRKSVKDQEGNTTHFKYDPLKRPTEMIHPDRTPDNLEDNPRIKVEYDKLGQMKALIDERGNRSEFEYDAAGRMKVVRSGVGGSQKTTSTRDAAGREITRTDALNRTTKFAYDKLDRIVETIFPDKTSTKTTYDAFGNVIAQTDQEERTTFFEYDALDRFTAVVDAKQQRTDYKYDEVGNLVYQEDANDRVTKFEYDGLSRRTAVVRPLLQRLETVYDKVGNIKRTTDFNGKTIEYEYDSLNRLKTKHFLNENRSVQFTYTPTGRRETVTDGRGITNYDYDERGLLRSRMEPDNTPISYTYNQSGLVETITTPSGTTTYRYDNLNRLEKVIDPNNKETIYTYDEVGNLKNISYPNGTSQTYIYDELNRLKYLVSKDIQGNILSSYTYTLDAVGNRKEVKEYGGRKVEYTYDELHRLTKEVISDVVTGNRTISYTYDAVGNRHTKDDSVEGLTTYNYDSNDRLKSETTAGVTTNYTYDNNGNLTLADVQNSPEQVEYFWDGENRLTSVEITDVSGTNEINYRYDADGIRVASIVDGGETRYLVDANRPYAEVLEEYAPGGGNRVSYVHGLDLISQNRNGNKSFYLFDGHSGVRQLTNGLGAVTDKYNYDAFGKKLQFTGSTNNYYLYRGEQFDPNVGWQYLRARYYDPNSGRFPSVDPFEGELKQPMSRHRYLYGNANPVTYSDPSGEISITQELPSSQLFNTLLGISLTSIGAVGTIYNILSNRNRDPQTVWTGTLQLFTVDASGSDIGPLEINPATEYHNCQVDKFFHLVRACLIKLESRTGNGFEDWLSYQVQGYNIYRLKVI